MLGELIKEPFLGFQKEALEFLKELSKDKNNNKLWFDKNRETYEIYLKKPMRDLIDSLAIEINKIDPDIVVNYKSIFRINRDIRFSKNKMPYKNLYSAAFAFGRVKSSEIPQFYFHFDPNEFIFASGQYSMDPDNLKKIRLAVYGKFREYKTIVSNKHFISVYNGVEGEAITKLPKGYENLDFKKTDDLLLNTLKMKQFYVSKSYKPEVVLNENLTDIIIENIKSSYDFNKFLSEAVK